jgi:hypothetical protein
MVRKTILKLKHLLKMQIALFLCVFKIKIVMAGSFRFLSVLIPILGKLSNPGFKNILQGR